MNNIKNKKSGFTCYIIFWLSQSVSQLGSAMTGFALVIWAYKQTDSAMAVSLMTFCSYVPYIIVSLLAGSFIDRHSKKTIMLVSDSVAALCTVFIWGMLAGGRLEIWHIYVANAITGFMNAFQQPAQSVAIGILVPRELYARASGMDSFSNNLLTVVTPVMAASVSAFWGLEGVILLDLCSFVFAFCVLLLFIRIPEEQTGEKKKETPFSGLKDGIAFLKERKGVASMILSMCLINFLSRLTYENILSPMLLARTGGNEQLMGMVSSVLGMGGIAGGLLVAAGRIKGKPVKMIYLSAAFSFLFGDLCMGLGRNVWIWSLAGLAASVPIPFLSAGQQQILYNRVPREIQGRIFAVRNALQYSSIPVGILLGGWLADYVFEPFMSGGSRAAAFLGMLVGAGKGSGMALMFLCTGVLGAAASIYWYGNREIKALDAEEEG